MATTRKLALQRVDAIHQAGIAKATQRSAVAQSDESTKIGEYTNAQQEVNDYFDAKDSLAEKQAIIDSLKTKIDAL